MVTFPLSSNLSIGTFKTLGWAICLLLLASNIIEVGFLFFEPIKHRSKKRSEKSTTKPVKSRLKKNQVRPMKKRGKKVKLDPMTPVKQNKPVLAKTTNKSSQKAAKRQTDTKEIRIKPFENRGKDFRKTPHPKKKASRGAKG